MRRMYVWTSTKNEWNAQNAVSSRVFRPSTPHNLIMRVLAICLEKPVQSTRCIGAKVFDLIRSLSPSLHNLWLLLVEKGMMGRERGCHCPLQTLFYPYPQPPYNTMRPVRRKEIHQGLF